MATYTYDTIKSGFTRQIRIYKDGLLIYTGPKSVADEAVILSEGKLAIIDIERPAGVKSASEWNITPQPGYIPPVPPAPPPTPQETEVQRQKEEAINNSNAQKVIPVDATAINNSNTDKPKGTAKLGAIVTSLGKKIIVGLIPIAIDLVRQFITQIVENEITKAKEKATAEQQKIQDQINTLDAKRKSGTKGLDP